MIGTRDRDMTLSHAEPDFMGNPPYGVAQVTDLLKTWFGWKSV